MSTIKREGNAVFLLKPLDQAGKTLAPFLAISKVTPCRIRNRDDEPTQDPISGFACHGTPLGRGHIIALFLGGPDIQQNYAPQYEQWQQAGRWKGVELNIKKQADGLTNGNTLYMAVKLSYENNGNHYQELKKKFDDHKIVFCDERRIPSRFEVYTFEHRNNKFVQELKDPQVKTIHQQIKKGVKLFEQVPVELEEDFIVNEMPDEDYQYWKTNLVRAIMRDLADVAKELCDKDLKELDEKYKGKKRSRQDVQRNNDEIDVLTATGFQNNKQFSIVKWQSDNAEELPAIFEKAVDPREYGVKEKDFKNLTTGNGAAGNIQKSLEGQKLGVQNKRRKLD
jgi:hypothetical protein